MPIGGGTGLGAATGRINIDTSDLNNVRVATQAVGQDAERNLGRIGAGAAQAQRNFEGLGVAARSLAGVFGIALGVAGVRQMGQFALEADRVATAFLRQQVAARNLAGSQSQLNELLRAYGRATGGAVDRATALANVTRLQAVGFADTAAELERVTRAARSASVAMGSSQEYILSQVQLAVANQSMMRLDQIGLGVSEVTARIDELRAANSGMSKEMAYQEAILGLLEEKFGALADSAEAQTSGTEQAARAWKDFRLQMGLTLGAPINTAGNRLAEVIDHLAEAIENSGRAADVAEKSYGNLEARWAGMTDEAMALARAEEKAAREAQEAAEAAAEARIERLSRRTGIGANIREPAISFPRFGTEQTTLIREWADQVQEIERSANQARLDATQQYEEQRTSTIRQYGLTIAREAEDFARQRARAEQQFAADIAEIREDAARREAKAAQDLARAITRARADSAERVAEWEEDHAKRVADLRAESNERLAELEEDYQRDRVRAAESHRDSLLDAAARLDAAAVVAEQRRFAREQQQAEEQHSERVADERENLDKRIAQEQEAHEERLADERKALDKRIAQEQEAHEQRLREAREADERRIEDMRADFEERKRLEDEDRAIRLARMAEDHANQLAEMARQQALRIEQIERQAAEERATLDEEFQKHLDELGLRTDAWLKEQERMKEESIKLFDAWWAEINKRFVPPSGVSHPSEADPYTGLPTPSGARPTLPYTPPAAPIGPSSVTGPTTVTIEAGAIVVNEAQRPGDTAREVREEVRRIFGELQ